MSTTKEKPVMLIEQKRGQKMKKVTLTTKVTHGPTKPFNPKKKK